MVTGKPELAVARSSPGDWARVFAPGFVKVMDWLSFGPGVTALDGAEAALGPTLFVATTVNV